MRLLTLSLAVLPWLTVAAEDPAARYKPVDLKALVASARTEVPGQRIIFIPAPVRFTARLAHLPAPQKTDYLMAALAMTKVANPPKVSQRIVLDYGGEKALAAYIEDAAAERLAKEGKPGRTLIFYALHAYNNNRGPALVVISYEP